MININEEHSKYVKLYSFSRGSTSPTDKKLVKEIVSRLDVEVLKNPNSKFLDPCAGVGTFGVAIYNELLKYHEPKWILEKMIFMVDTLRVNCDIIKKLGFVNVYNEDYLKLKLDMKFDVIIGNPPYQDSGKTQGKNSSLWTKFIINSNGLVKENGYISFIVPISWIAPSESQKNELKDVFFKNNLVYLNTECKNFFNVGSTFSYFIIKKNNQYLQTNINDSFYEDIRFNFLPKKINKITLSIAKKIFFTHDSKIDFSSSLRNDKLVDGGQYFVWYGNTLKRSNFLGKNFDKLKVVVNKPGYLNPRFDNRNYNTSANNYWVEVSSECEANNIISFFNSQIGKILFEKLFKYSGYNSLGVLKSLPTVIKNHQWDTKKFIEIFNLNEDEIKELT
jgi:16S rRNA G966 N2-methylase RsmD